MYKIVFVVAVFAFAIQGSLGSPLSETDNSAGAPVAKPVVSSDAQPKAALENKAAGDDTPVTTTTAAPATTATAATTEAPKSGASSTEICLLLVQVSSLALVAKHMIL